MRINHRVVSILIGLGTFLWIGQTGSIAAEESMGEKIQEAVMGQDIKKQFIGAWRLVSIEAKGPNSEAMTQRYGAKPVGYIIYTADGRMSAQLMRPDRARFASDEFEQATTEEAKAAFDGYMNYFGTYTVNEKEGFVTHHVEGSLFPNYVGTEQKRFFELSGDQLVLKPPPRQINGETQTLRITWQRVR
jgi:hypothetical protein